jgi:predicted nucleotidyltransferase
MNTSAAKQPELKVVSEKKSQIDLNIEAYARVYRKCRDEAMKIVEEEHDEDSDDRLTPAEWDEVDNIAELFFDRFWTDQMTVEQMKVDQEKFTPLTDQVQKLMERQRGGNMGDYIGVGQPLIGGFR